MMLPLALKTGEFPTAKEDCEELPARMALTRLLAGTTPELRESWRHLGNAEAVETSVSPVGAEVGCIEG